MTRKKPLLTGAAFVVALALGVTLGLLWYAPPLRGSSDYTVRYAVDGVAHKDAQLFRPLGISSRYYLFIPSPSTPQYQWIVVDFDRRVAAVPLFGVTCPCGSPCVHRGQALGVLLTDPKTEDHWDVGFSKTSVHLSNRAISITLTRAP
jgi:hypothetical protein